jgi:RNA polymerase sigma-70 factor (ECF subfamily)
MSEGQKTPDPVVLAAAASAADSTHGTLSLSLVLGSVVAANAGAAQREAEQADEVERLVTTLFEELCQPVYRYIRGFVRDTALARDVTQEVFVKLCTELAAGRQLTNVRAWLFRIAHNLAIDEQRKLRVREAHEDYSEAADVAFLFFSDPSPSAEQQLLQRERHGWLREAVQMLSAQERRCLFLRAQGLRYREIADVLDIKLPTVVTFLTRAIQKLAKACP